MLVVRARLLFLVIALFLVATPHDVEACTIIIPATSLPRFAPAPPNAHVWIRGLQLPLYAGASFVLVATDGTPAPVDVRSWPTSMVWELAPQARLRANARYELWGVPRSKQPTPPVLLGTFKTGADDDVTAPSAPKLVRAAEITPLGSCPTFIELTGTPGSDTSGETLHAVWLSDDRGVLHYADPPNEIFAWTERRAEVNKWFMHKGTRRIGVRAVDVAGNVSAPAEIDL
jgi:hypothetical protein